MKLHLPSGRVVDAEAPIADDLPLGDAHVVQAVQMKLGVLPEEEVEIECHACGEPIRLKPCARLEIAPWVDDEAHDPELDVTLPFGEPHPIRPVRVGKVRMARTVTLRPLTWGEAQRGERGIVALGRETDPKRIDDALHGDFRAIAEAWIDSHYVPRLRASVACTACGARNDVDAPYVRELDLPPPEQHGDFPSFDDWDAAVRDLAGEWPADVELLTDEGPPGVDAGGDTIWGCYDEPQPDALVPHPARVTLFYRTFEAVWREEGPYDWKAEIEETLEHELEHHVAFLRGHDPMAEEEARTIADEAVRVIGRREVQRRAATELGGSFVDFLRRTWLLWLIVLVAFVLVWLSQHGSGANPD